MNKDNIVCVNVCGRTTSIALYEVETNETEITKVKMNDYKEIGEIKFSSIIDEINKMCAYKDVTHAIMDGNGMCCGIADLLETDDVFWSDKVYRVRKTTSSHNEYLVLTKQLIESNKLSIDKNCHFGLVSSYLDLSKFELSISTTGCVSLKQTKDYNDVFNNIVYLMCGAKKCTIDTDDKIKRRKIEGCLEDVLEILIDDLSKVNKLNSVKVNDLIRLIDKVNYLRGQY